MYGYESNDILKAIGSKTTILLNNKSTIEGYLYTIDPESHHVVLFQPEAHVVIVFHHDIQQLSITRDDVMNDMDQRIQCNSPLLIQQRRQRVIALFEQHRVPIEYDNDDPVIHVLGARVESPYVATSVVCDNALIRQRVRTMLLDINTC